MLYCKRTVQRRFFTLLEVMIAICLFLAMASVLCFKMHTLIAKKRFASYFERLESHLWTCHWLALNMQADWQARLRKEEKGWILETKCIDDPQSTALVPLVTPLPLSLFFEKEKKEEVIIAFSGTGQISPNGTLFFCLDPDHPEEYSLELKIPELFFKEENDVSKKKLGPLHPADCHS